MTKHRTPWKIDPPPPFDDDIWELYGPDDWTQAHNLAAENPEKLAEMQRLWLIEAVKYNVVPLDDRSFERFNPDIAGRPQLIRGNSQLLFPGMRVSENCVVNVKNKSHTVTANVAVPESGCDRRHRHPGRQRRRLDAVRPRGQAQVLLQLLRHQALHGHRRQPDSSRKHQVRMEFAYDGGGLAKGGDVTLYYDGKPVGAGRVEQTQPMALLRRRGLRRRRRQRLARLTRLRPHRTTSSPGRSTGCRSTSATTATTTSSNPRTGSRSRWRGNNVAALGDSPPPAREATSAAAPASGEVPTPDDSGLRFGGVRQSGFVRLAGLVMLGFWRCR